MREDSRSCEGDDQELRTKRVRTETRFQKKTAKEASYGKEEPGEQDRISTECHICDSVREVTLTMMNMDESG